MRKGMNLKKFRQEVMDEMSDSSGDEEADQKSENVPGLSNYKSQNHFSGSL